MFVECLAEGRGVSLPAGSIGAARSVVAGVGAYSRVRKQFRVPIAEFGGIQEGESKGCDTSCSCTVLTILSPHSYMTISTLSVSFQQPWPRLEATVSSPSPEETS